MTRVPPRRLGILGGMGPEATVLMMQKLIDRVPATDDRDHIPLLVDMNTQVPSRIAWLIEGRGEDPGPVLVAMARRLEAMGAEALAMPCNTAHHWAPDIRAAVGVPFLDMLALSARAARARAGAGGVVGILASPAVRRTGDFARALEAEGLRPAWPEDEDALLAAIRAIKRHGPDAAARAALGAASASVMGQGARVQLVACTELSLIADAADPGAEVMDTLDILVDAAVRFALGGDEGDGADGAG